VGDGGLEAQTLEALLVTQVAGAFEMGLLVVVECGVVVFAELRGLALAVPGLCGLRVCRAAEKQEDGREGREGNERAAEEDKRRFSGGEQQGDPSSVLQSGECVIRGSATRKLRDVCLRG